MYFVRQPNGMIDYLVATPEEWEQLKGIVPAHQVDPGAEMFRGVPVRIFPRFAPPLPWYARWWRKLVSLYNRLGALLPGERS